MNTHIFALLTVTAVTRDLLALQSSQTSLTLNLISPNGCLAGLPRLLQRPLGMLYHTNWQMWVCPNPGPLHLVRLELTKHIPTDSTCVIYSRSVFIVGIHFSAYHFGGQVIYLNYKVNAMTKVKVQGVSWWHTGGFCQGPIEYMGKGTECSVTTLGYSDRDLLSTQVKGQGMLCDHTGGFWPGPIEYTGKGTECSVTILGDSDKDLLGIQVTVQGVLCDHTGRFWQGTTGYTGNGSGSALWPYWEILTVSYWVHR